MIPKAVFVSLLLAELVDPALTQNSEEPRVAAELSVEIIPKEESMLDAGKTIPIGDAALFVSEVGKVDSQPIVLLHGGLGSRHDFLPLAGHLAADHRLIAIDTRGHGRSTLGSAPLTYHQLEQDAAAVLAELGLTNAAIIGHSDGGIVALRLAASEAVHPRFVVAVGAHWQMPSDDPTREIYQSITVDEWRGMFAEQVRSYEAENPAPDFATLFDATAAMWLGSDDKAYPGRSVRSITSPLLVIRGDDDFLVSRRQGFDLVEQVEGARLLNLPFAAHTVLKDSPEDVLPALKAFFSSVSEAGEGQD
ncbi:alpha/beta hydrolase [Aquamicrobium lusatiense]|uniref:alpha/beta fold hydrolase n=1 Tax=Aquamicrobium lusatiense TaxID=89772 RepID=UPI00245428F6|nr:alpha/beta hydrolase [Aquamicrobium lusatiense]MDH4992336.1 alpha/beta hydrolase [Aquamicrobium lusatiense]